MQQHDNPISRTTVRCMGCGRKNYASQSGSRFCGATLRSNQESLVILPGGNGATWLLDGSNQIPVEGYLDQVRQRRNINGVTLIGAEPFSWARGLVALGRLSREHSMSVVTFTGYQHRRLVAALRLPAVAGEGTRKDGTARTKTILSLPPEIRTEARF